MAAGAGMATGAMEHSSIDCWAMVVDTVADATAITRLAIMVHPAHHGGRMDAGGRTWNLQPANARHFSALNADSSYCNTIRAVAKSLIQFDELRAKSGAYFP